MTTSNKIGLFIAMFALMFTTAQTASAQGTDKIQNYFSDTAVKVKATEDPTEKRALLSNSLQTMSKALKRIESAGLTSESDLEAVKHLESSIQEKQSELAGIDGFLPIPDGQLNAFADYVVQDMEQADRSITIGVVTALLLVIILLLL